MKITILFAFLAVLCLSLIGCSSNKDADVTAFTTELDTVTADITKKIDANPTSAGVDEAQKVLDAKKADLKAKHSAIITGLKNAGTITPEAQKKFTESTGKNTSAIAGIGSKHTGAMMKDPAMSQKIAKLATDYTSIFQP